MIEYTFLLLPMRIPCTISQVVAVEGEEVVEGVVAVVDASTALLRRPQLPVLHKVLFL